MKYLATLPFIFLCFSALSQDDVGGFKTSKNVHDVLPNAPLKLTVNENGIIEYRDTMYFPGLSSLQIYNKTKEWIIGSFKYSKIVIDGDVSPSMLKLNIQHWALYGDYNDVCIINIKDGALRLTISDMRRLVGTSFRSIESDCIKKKTGELRKDHRSINLFELTNDTFYMYFKSLSDYISSPNW